MKKILAFALAISLFSMAFAFAEPSSLEELQAMSKEELVELAAGLLGIGDENETASGAEAASDEYISAQKGDEGENVQKIQQRLIDKGYLTGTADGIFGGGTQKSIIAFQTQNNLTASGIADAEMQELLFSEDCPQAQVAVTGIKIEPDGTIVEKHSGKKSSYFTANALVGASIDISGYVSVEPENATEKGVAYSIDDTSIATIDENGVITGVSKGKATITITSLEKTESPKEKTLKVSVGQPVTSFTLEKDSFSVGNGGTYTLPYSVGPEDADNKGIIWESADPSIVEVTSKGVVKGIDTGSTTITGTTADGSGLTASAVVTVITSVKKIELSDKAVTIIDDESATVTATVSPENATNPKLAWSSSDTSIATVDATGKITAKSSGECTITASATDDSGVTASVKVSVEPHLPVYITSINWQTTWGQKNGKMGVEAENLSTTKTIKSFDYTVVCYNAYTGTSATSHLTYSGSSIKPGKSAKSKLSSTSVSGFTTAYRVDITPTKVYFSDGTSVEIPSEYQYTSTFTM